MLINDKHAHHNTLREARIEAERQRAVAGAATDEESSQPATPTPSASTETGSSQSESAATETHAQVAVHPEATAHQAETNHASPANREPIPNISDLMNMLMGGNREAFNNAANGMGRNTSKAFQSLHSMSNSLSYIRALASGLITADDIESDQKRGNNMLDKDNLNESMNIFKSLDRDQAKELAQKIARGDKDIEQFMQRLHSSQNSSTHSFNTVG